MKWIFIALTFITTSASAQNAYDISFENHIAHLVEEGHLDNSDAQETIINNQIDSKDIQKRKEQARGIASTLSKVKVYSISNEPIEIQP